MLEAPLASSLACRSVSVAGRHLSLCRTTYPASIMYHTHRINHHPLRSERYTYVRHPHRRVAIPHAVCIPWRLWAWRLVGPLTMTLVIGHCVIFLFSWYGLYSAVSLLFHFQRFVCSTLSTSIGMPVPFDRRLAVLQFVALSCAESAARLHFHLHVARCSCDLRPLNPYIGRG